MVELYEQPVRRLESSGPRYPTSVLTFLRNPIIIHTEPLQHRHSSSHVSMAHATLQANALTTCHSMRLSLLILCLIAFANKLENIYHIENDACTGKYGDYGGSAVRRKYVAYSNGIKPLWGTMTRISCK